MKHNFDSVYTDFRQSEQLMWRERKRGCEG